MKRCKRDLLLTSCYHLFGSSPFQARGPQVVTLYQCIHIIYKFSNKTKPKTNWLWFARNEKKIIFFDMQENDNNVSKVDFCNHKPLPWLNFLLAEHTKYVKKKLLKIKNGIKSLRWTFEIGIFLDDCLHFFEAFFTVLVFMMIRNQLLLNMHLGVTFSILLFTCKSPSTFLLSFEHLCSCA